VPTHAHEHAAGLLAVRGAEVVEVRDEEGGLMNDFTGRVRIEDRKPPKGEPSVGA
jgi:intron-binding protein aquarius